MPAITSEAHRAAAGEFRSLLAAYREAEDLINIGAYAEGSSPIIDRARKYIAPIQAYLRQPASDGADYADSVARLTAMFDDAPV